MIVEIRIQDSLMLVIFCYIFVDVDTILNNEHIVLAKLFAHPNILHDG